MRGIMAVICIGRAVQDPDGTTRGAPPGTMARREAWSGRGDKRLRDVAPQDMRGCGIGSYIWGQKVEVIIDTFVLGHSLQEHGHKAKRFLCINNDTGEIGHFAFVESLLASSAGGTCQFATTPTRIGASGCKVSTANFRRCESSLMET